MYWLIFAALSLILLISIMISHVEVNFVLKKDQKDDRIEYNVKALLGIIRLQFEIPMIKFKGVKEGVEVESDLSFKNTGDKLLDYDDNVSKNEALDFFQKIQTLKNNISGFSDWVTDALSNVKSVHFQWKTNVGIGDAAQTAITTGVIWSIKTTLLGFVFKRISLMTKPVIGVNPIYNTTHFSTEVVSKIKVRHFYVSLAFIRLIIRIIRVKGGLKTWTRIFYETYTRWKSKKKHKAV